MSNPSPRKTKQTSLSQFYRNSIFNQQQPQTYSHSAIQLTPTKLKSSHSNDHDPNKFAGRIAPSLTSSKLSNPLIGQQEYKALDINSHMKLKMDDMFEDLNQKPTSAISENVVYKENLFGKFGAQNNVKGNYMEGETSLGYGQYEPSSGIVTRKFQNEYSDLDYDLSVQPEEIKLPEVKRYENPLSRFSQDDKLVSNFLITPQNSQIKSPQKQNILELHNYTPLNLKDQDRQPLNSEIIERLRFNAQTTEKKQQDSPKKKEGQLMTRQIKTFQPYIVQKKASPHRQQVKQARQQPKIPSPTRNPKRKPEKQQQQPHSPQPIIQTTTSSKPTPLQTPTSSVSKIPLISTDILSSDDQDSSQILTKLMQLQTQVSELKTHKYQFAISKYQQEMKYELQKRLEADIRQINREYDEKQGVLRNEANGELQMFERSIEDVGKYKKTYAIILAQLRENKEKIEQEYREKVQHVNKYKERLIHEWKRQSNDQIKKILNNTHTKHSIKLSQSRQKLSNKQIEEKIIKAFSKDKGNATDKSKTSPQAWMK